MEYDSSTFDFSALLIYFPDGSGVKLSYGGMDYDYCIDARNLKNKNFIKGKDCFRFALYPYNNEIKVNGIANYSDKGVEPYVLREAQGTYEGLKRIGAYAKIIQLNGWKIPDDYPLKF